MIRGGKNDMIGIHVGGTGIATTIAIPSIIIVPIMPFAIPPGIGSPASMDFIAL